MKLTDVQIRNLAFEGKQRKFTDGAGLYLLVTKAGKYWRYDYRINQKRKTLALGVYPELSLKQAREAHIEARALVQQGIDPSFEKARERALNAVSEKGTFECIAEEWLTRQVHWADSHRSKVQLRLKNDVFPYLGHRGIADLEAPEILFALRKVEARGAVDSAHRIKQSISQVFRYAIATGRCSADPTVSLKGALSPIVKRNYPTLKVSEVGGLMRAVTGYNRNFLTRSALLLGLYTIVRSGELRGAHWSEIDWGDATWRVPASRMKGKREHVVFLSKQSLTLLRELQAYSGRDELILPGFRSRKRPVTGEALNAVLRELGYRSDQLVYHSFRSIFSTICNEEIGANPDVIEQALAHQQSDSIRAAYNRAEYRQQRRELMQQYADFIDHLRDHKARVVNLFSG